MLHLFTISPVHLLEKHFNFFASIVWFDGSVVPQFLAVFSLGSLLGLFCAASCRFSVEEDCQED